MGKIYYLMGKSASGKDSIFQRLCSDPELDLKTVTLYTTRPIRNGETDGKEYHFISEEGLSEIEASGKIIEQRAYQTVCGVWKYLTVDDGQIDLEQFDYLVIGTLESFIRVRAYFGEQKVLPLYVHVEDGVRLERALERERLQKSPKYAELCRRFLADEADFSEDKLKEAGVVLRFENTDITICTQQIKKYISGDRAYVNR